jgi:hypothetical protein
MRRAAVAVMVGGYAFGGIGSGVGPQHVISDVTLTAAIRPVAKKTTAVPAGRALPAMKTVQFRGYQIEVPAGWPVYSLDKDPSQCVRYDINAVYLGTPGPNQNCPPGLIGRADTLSIGAPAAPGQPSTPVQTDQRAQPGPNRLTPHMNVAPGTIMQNAALHEFALATPNPAFSVTATYGSDPDAMLQMLTNLRQAMSGRAAAGSSAGSAKPTAPAQPNQQAKATAPANKPSSAASQPSPTSTLPPGLVGWWPSPPPSPVGPSPTPAPTPPAKPSPAPPVAATSGTLAGFDTCTAPSLATMKAWRAKYSATAIYIGGQEMACDYGNLSASWIQATEAMGWSLMPTFVGLQAPCDSFSQEINPSQAASEGTAAANQAVADATMFHLGQGTPIYYDMEGYDHTKASCRNAVLSFLDAWTRQLNASGYVSGVYSSADSAAIDLQTNTTLSGRALAEPQAMWFALWDNATNLTGSPYLNATVWSASQRSKQYAGAHTVTVGGIALDIDSDLVNSAVARG